MQYVVDLFVKDQVTPPIKNLVTESSSSNFMQGNVAFMQNGPWQVVNVRKAEFDWDIIRRGSRAPASRFHRGCVRASSSTSRGSCSRP